MHINKKIYKKIIGLISGVVLTTSFVNLVPDMIPGLTETPSTVLADDRKVEYTETVPGGYRAVGEWAYSNSKPDTISSLSGKSYIWYEEDCIHFSYHDSYFQENSGNQNNGLPWKTLFGTNDPDTATDNGGGRFNGNNLIANVKQFLIDRLNSTPWMVTWQNLLSKASDFGAPAILDGNDGYRHDFRVLKTFVSNNHCDNYVSENEKYMPIVLAKPLFGFPYEFRPNALGAAYDAGVFSQLAASYGFHNYIYEESGLWNDSHKVFMDSIIFRGTEGPSGDYYKYELKNPIKARTKYGDFPIKYINVCNNAEVFYMRQTHEMRWPEEWLIGYTCEHERGISCLGYCEYDENLLSHTVSSSTVLLGVNDTHTFNDGSNVYATQTTPYKAHRVYKYRLIEKDKCKVTFKDKYLDKNGSVIGEATLGTQEISAGAYASASQYYGTTKADDGKRVFEYAGCDFDAGGNTYTNYTHRHASGQTSITVNDSNTTVKRYPPLSINYVPLIIV